MSAWNIRRKQCRGPSSQANKVLLKKWTINIWQRCFLQGTGCHSVTSYLDCALILAHFSSTCLSICLFICLPIHSLAQERAHLSFIHSLHNPFIHILSHSFTRQPHASPSYPQTCVNLQVAICSHYPPLSKEASFCQWYQWFGSCHRADILLLFVNRKTSSCKKYCKPFLILFMISSPWCMYIIKHRGDENKQQQQGDTVLMNCQILNKLLKEMQDSQSGECWLFFWLFCLIIF